jgi:DNA-binding HxlR family transcriptional regulator
MRVHLQALADAKLLERRRHSGFPGPVDYELLPAGNALHDLLAVFRDWLLASPEGPIQPGSVAAKSSTKALVEGWSTAIVRALAAKSLALTELSRLITGLSYPSLERRLGAMRMAGLIERCSSPGRCTPYTATEWLRRATVPLAAAAQWERAHLPDETSPIKRIDVEAAFLLAVPLVRLPADLSGTCRLAVETSKGSDAQAGVIIKVEQGRITSCRTRLDSRADAWAVGSALDWISAISPHEGEELELGGQGRLARAMLKGLRQALLP